MPSPRIVPLTVLTHDDDAKHHSGLRSSRGCSTTATTTTYGPHYSRVFPPRSPPAVRSVWSITDDGGNNNSDRTAGCDLSPFLPRTPNSGLSWTSPPGISSSRQQRPALPKITLTPRSVANKRSPVIPRFPFVDDDDTEQEDKNEANHRFHAEPVTVASFLPQRFGHPTREASNSSLSSSLLMVSASPRVGTSIFGPPTPREFNDSFQQLQEPPAPQHQHQNAPIAGRPDDMESLSDDDGSGENDEFLLAFPSTLAEEKLQQQQRCRNVKARKSSEELLVLGDKTRSMTSMASSSYASLRGIVYAPSDPDLYAAHVNSTEPLQYGVNDSQNTHLQSLQQDGYIGWTFDADDHYVPARDLVTPQPFPNSSTTGINTHLPPLLLPSSQQLATAAATTTAVAASSSNTATTRHPSESTLKSMSTE